VHSLYKGRKWFNPRFSDQGSLDGGHTVIDPKNISLIATGNCDRIHAMLQDKEMWDSVTDDLHPVFDWMELKDKKLVVFECFYNEKFAGAFLFIEYGDGTWEAHTMFLKKYRGKVALIAAKEATNRMLESVANEVVSLCPMNRPEILRFALAAGYKKDKTLKDSWMKNGKIYDSVIVKVTKEI
jgi:hypothetical protein